MSLMQSTLSQWNMDYNHLPYSFKEQMFQSFHPYDPHLHLPQLHSPKFHVNVALPLQKQVNHDCQIERVSFHNSTTKNGQTMDDQVIDWRILDKFVASQLSQEGISKDLNDTNAQDNLPIPGKEEGDHSSVMHNA